MTSKYSFTAPRLSTTLVSGTFLHILWILFAPSGVLISDAKNYHDLATSLAQGGGYVAEGHVVTAFVPGYPFLLSLAYRALGATTTTAFFLNVALLVLASAATYRTARSYGETAARLAAALLLFAPPLFVYSATTTAECAVICGAACFLGSTAIVFDGLEGRVWMRGLGVAGIAIPLSLLCVTKPELILWAPFVPLAAWMHHRKEGNFLQTARQALGTTVRDRFAVAAVLVSCVAIGATTAAWTARNSSVVGHRAAISSASGYSLWLTAHEPQLFEKHGAEYDEAWARCEDPDSDPTTPKVDEFLIDGCMRDGAVRNIKAHPAHYAKVVLQNVPRMLVGSHTESFPPLSNAFGAYRAAGQNARVAAKLALLGGGLVFVALALLGAFKTRRHPMTLPLVFAIIIKIAIHAVIFSTARYSLHIYPIFAVFAGAFLAKYAGENVPAAGSAITP